MVLSHAEGRCVRGRLRAAHFPGPRHDVGDRGALVGPGRRSGRDRRHGLAAGKAGNAGRSSSVPSRSQPRPHSTRRSRSPRRSYSRRRPAAGRSTDGGWVTCCATRPRDRERSMTPCRRPWAPWITGWVPCTPWGRWTTWRPPTPCTMGRAACPRPACSPPTCWPRCCAVCGSPTVNARRSASCGRSCGWLVAPLRLILRLPAPPHRPRVRVRRGRPERALRQLLLTHAISYRGPPAGTAVA